MAQPERSGARAWADALAPLPRDRPIYLAGCCGEPTAALEAMEEDPGISAGRCFAGVWIPGVNRFDPSAFGPGARALTLFATPELAPGLASGRVGHLPMHYSEAWRGRGGAEGPGGGVVQVSPPQSGMVSLGLAADFTPALVASGVPLVAQVNPLMPAPPGAPRLPVERFAALIEAETPLPTLPPSEPGSTARAIGRHVAELLRQGDTLQLGFGKVAAGVLAALEGARGLRFHGGMAEPALAARLDEGVFGGRVTVGVALGDAGWYARLGDDPRYRFAPVGETHAASTLGGIASFVSVNTALEVDLMGQVNCERVEGRQVSGLGGLADFARGARLSPGGRAIVALPSTLGSGRASRIVPALSAGSPASLSRADLDIVVTEHGVADLRGADAEARARALVAVAAPEFRDALARAWRDGVSGVAR